MTNRKLQVAVDEFERLRDTVEGFRERNGALPEADSDAGRALSELQDFCTRLHELGSGRFVTQGRPQPPFRRLHQWWRRVVSAH
jgi:hypothetical protein